MMLRRNHCAGVLVGGSLKHVAALARPQAEEGVMVKLVEVISGEKKRRVVVVGPTRSLYRGRDEVSVRIWKLAGAR